MSRRRRGSRAETLASTPRRRRGQFAGPRRPRRRLGQFAGPRRRRLVSGRGASGWFPRRSPAKLGGVAGGPKQRQPVKTIEIRASRDPLADDDFDEYGDDVDEPYALGCTCAVLPALQEGLAGAFGAWTPGDASTESAADDRAAGDA